MKPKAFLTLCITALLACFILISSTVNTSNKITIQDADASLAAFHTDQYVWEKMVESFQVFRENPVNLKWEMWPTTVYAYSDECNGVLWPEVPVEGSLKHPKAISMFNTSNNLAVTQFADLTLNPNPYYEELRINKPMFEYIQTMELYNQDKIYELAKKGMINFPPKSMMIKAQWLPGDSNTLKGYYTKEARIKVKSFTKNDEEIDITTTYADTLIGLVGFHLVTHELPNWVWSTFEYAGNEGLCDYIGCKDNFGCEPAYIPPHKKINQGYQIGETSEALKKLFAENNIPLVFENYRLKGSQTEYTDNKGDTLILGNSILEMNLVTSSSCISCHARATLNNASPKRENLPMFLPDSFGLPYLGKDNELRGWYPTCYTGTPIPSDYLNADDNGQIHPDSIFYQTNFMWQLAQHAKVCNDASKN